ncbi:translocation protein TolB [bacterium BMS3Abin03]|nr:translocation protein TolB [bacterium BMS3Abin03]
MLNRYLKYPILFFLLFSQAATAQFFFFGRNKVHYEEFDWKILKTEHFDIYYYGQMQKLAEIGAYFAEEIYDELKVEMNNVVTRRVPLIFYNTSLEFQQTNTTPGLLPEGVGGFFEFLKGRVVLPSNGSLKDFKHVIRHELVHVFMTNKIYRVLRDHRLPTSRMPPLWYVEGLAEFLSTKFDSQAEMVIRDAVINNYFVGLRDIYRIFGTFLMYKEGQSFLEYASETYGKQKVLNLLENFWMDRSFNRIMEYTFRKRLEKIDADWQYYLKKKYYPCIATDLPLAQGAVKITKEGFNFSPVSFQIDSLKFLYFIANRDGYSSIYRMMLDKDNLPAGSPELILRGEKTEEFEAFHLFQSSIDISKAGLIAFVTKKGGTDAIHFYSIEQNKVVKTFQSHDLVNIISPKFSSNGNRIVFHAVDRKGFMDLYTLDLLDDKLYRLTNDYYDDRDPIFGLNNQQIIFTSDRTGGKYAKKYNLFSLNLNNHEIEYITFLNTQNFTPVLSPDKTKLLFTSELDGVRNIWELPVENGVFGKRIKRISRFITSVFTPSFVDSAALVFSGFENFSINLYEMNDYENALDSTEYITMNMNEEKTVWFASVIQLPAKRKTIKYKKQYSLDFAQSVVTTDPVFGTRGGAVLSMSDLLGDDRYYFLLYNSANVQSDILKSFNVIVQRANFGKRVNYAYGIFHLSGRRYDLRDPDQFFYERTFGGSFVLNYPVSKFQRLEATVTLANSSKEVIENLIERKALLMTNTIAYVHDNSLWGPTGPIAGSRGLVILGYTSDIKYSNVNYFSVVADYRYYARVALTTLFAFRAAFFYNEGKEARRYVIGGSWDLRGYNRFSIRGTKVWFTSVEFRFPLIEKLTIKFPVLSLGFFGIRGALFFDAAGAWDKEYTETLGSIGTGVRINVFRVLTLRYDIGKKIENNFTRFQDGLFYQFFFGWDF